MIRLNVDVRLGGRFERARPDINAVHTKNAKEKRRSPMYQSAPSAKLALRTLREIFLF